MVCLIAALTSFSSISNFLTRFFFFTTGDSSGVTSVGVFFLFLGRFFFFISPAASVVEEDFSSETAGTTFLTTCFCFLSSPRSILPTTLSPRFLFASLSFGETNFSCTTGV